MARTATATPQFRAPGILLAQDHSGRQLQQLGDALGSAGAGLARLGDDIAMRKRVAEVKEAQSEARAYLQGMLSPVEGFRSKLGKAAMDAFEPSLEAMRKKRDDIAVRMQDPESRRMFKDSTEGDFLQARATMETHLSGASREYDLGQTKALIDNDVNAYIDAQGDPRQSAKLLLRIASNVGEFSDNAAFAPAQRDQLLRQTLTEAHSEVVQRMVANGQAEEGREYLDEHAATMDATAVSDLRRVVQLEATRSRAVDVASVVARKVESAMQGPAGQQAMAPREYRNRAKADLAARVQSGEITKATHDAAVDLIVDDYKRRQQDYAEETDAVVEASEKFLRDNPTAGVAQIPSQLRAELEKRNKIGDLHAFVSSNRRMSTDPVVMDEVEQRTPAEWRERSAVEWRAMLRTKLRPADLRYAMGLHEQAVGTADDDTQRYVSTHKRVTRLGRELGMLPKDGVYTSDRERARKQVAWDEFFEDRIQPKLLNRQKELKRSLTDHEIDEVLDGITADTLKRRVPGWIYDGVEEVPAIMVDPDDPSAVGDLFELINGEPVYLRQVPSEDRKGIAKKLRAKGDPHPSAAKIIRYWHEIDGLRRAQQVRQQRWDSLPPERRRMDPRILELAGRLAPPADFAAPEAKALHEELMRALEQAAQGENR